MTDEPTRGSSSVASAGPNDAAAALRRILETRRSVRSYAPTAVDPRLVTACIDAARLAPSPHNSQPWRFAVPWERSVRERMLDAMAAPWRADLRAEGMGEPEVDALLERSQHRVLDAPAAVVVFLDPTAASRWPTDRRQAGERVMALHAVGAAIHTFLLAAAARGLGSCWVCSPLFAPREVAAALEVGRHLEAQALITLGYPAVPPKRRGRLSPAEISLTVGRTEPGARVASGALAGRDVRSEAVHDQTPGGTMLRLGYKASAEQFGPRQLLDFGVAAEQNGFDSVVVSDHFQPWRHTDGHAPYSFAWLAALGERTERVLLGTSVVTPTFRYHPVIVAQAMGTLGELNPDRVFLGVGTGESLNEVPVLDIEWPDFKERFARLKEAVELMQRLWREDFVTYEGQYYRTRAATVYDRPERPVGMYVAASGEVAARYAGRVADGFICTSGKGMELYADKLLPAVREGAAKAGRDYDTIEKTIEMKVSFDADRDRAMEDTKIWAALALPAEKKTGVEDPREMERLATEAEPYAHKRWLVSDDADEHIEQLRPYLDLGFSHLIFHAPGDDQRRFIELYGREVLPRLRAGWGS